MYCYSLYLDMKCAGFVYVEFMFIVGVQWLSCVLSVAVCVKNGQTKFS